VGETIALVKKSTVDIVADKIRQFQDSGELHFPANYSPENALKSAWLVLQSVEDKQHRPALEVCTRDSIANSLLDMVVQGLNPAKNQCYFIVYGNKLTCQRSYMGTMAVTKSATGARDIFAEVVYKGDDFAFEIVRGKKRVTKHVQTLETIEQGEIVGAYCTLVDADDREFTEFMTIAEIKQAWKQSKMNSESEGSTHNKFPQEMCKKTVINRACKTFLNSSDDSSLVMKHYRRTEAEAEQASVEAEINENANQQPIDVEYQFQDSQAPTDAEQSSFDFDAALQMKKAASGDPPF
jgi:recombination protein RecT